MLTRKMSKKKIERQRAVSYIRVSTSSQANGSGLEMQRQSIKKYCKLHHLDLPHEYEYCDSGISAMSISSRAELSSLIQNVKLGLVQNIVVYNIDRLSRNLDDLRMLRKLFLKYDVTLHTMNGIINFTNANDNLFFNIMGLMAENEALLIQQRTRDALSLKKENKQRTGAVPYGFYVCKDKSLRQKPSEQKIVKLVRNWWRKGFIYAEICKGLRKRNLKTRTGRDFAIQQVKRILQK